MHARLFVEHSHLTSDFMTSKMKITSKRKIILIITLSYGLATAQGAQYTEPHDGQGGHEKGFHERLPGIGDVSTQVQGKVNILQFSFFSN